MQLFEIELRLLAARSFQVALKVNIVTSGTTKLLLDCSSDLNFVHKNCIER